MGWYTTYEVEFNEYIDWDDDIVKETFETLYTVEWLYLRDFGKPRLICMCYSQTPIERILTLLNYIYPVARFREYETTEWKEFIK
jgi:hypothetical protein